MTRHVHNAIRLALGISLVLHGLGSSVLPLRGIDFAAPGEWIPAWALAYTAAIVGFVAAGLGVLGVRWLERSAVYVSSIAGAGNIPACVWLGDADLWPGVVLSLVLPIAVARWSAMIRPARAIPPSWRRRLGDVSGMAFLAWIGAATIVWPWSRSWGADRADWTLALPGDASNRNPAMELLHVVSIDAPPSAVWPWLVQLGQDRAGFYSYERLERLFGVDVHNVRELRPEWQSRQAGDRLFATQAGYLGGLFGDQPGWTVDVAESNRALVLRYWGAFVLEPDRHGGTRFLIRSTISNPRIPVWAAALNFSAFELPHFIMERRMMLNIKALAESRHNPRNF